MNHNAAKASMMITIEIAAPRAEGSSALPVTCRAFNLQAFQAANQSDDHGEKWCFHHADHEMPQVQGFVHAGDGTQWQEDIEVERTHRHHRRMPATIAINVNSGNIANKASKRGMTNRSAGSRPCQIADHFLIS